MPRRKRFRSRKKSKRRVSRFGRRRRAIRRYNRPSVRVIKEPSSVVPDILRTRLVYSALEKLTDAGGALTSVTYSGNSAYDPQTALGGHQPMGYDQLSALYEEYIVYGCSYKIKVIGYSDTGVLTVTKTDDATQVGTSDWVNMIEQPYTQQRYLQIGAVKPTIIKGYMGVKKLRGQSKYDDYQTTLTGASPSNQVFLNLNYQTFDKASTSSIDCVVTLKFYCKFKGRVQLASS